MYECRLRARIGQALRTCSAVNTEPGIILKLPFADAHLLPSLTVIIDQEQKERLALSIILPNHFTGIILATKRIEAAVEADEMRSADPTRSKLVDVNGMVECRSGV